MFRRDTLSTLVVVFLLAVLLRQVVLAWTLGLVFVTLVVADRWSRWGLRHLRYERTLSQTHAFVGDKVTLTLRVVNPKLLSVPSLTCADALPDCFDYGSVLPPSTRPNTVILQRTVALRPYEAISWTIPFTCKVRGLHTFGPIHLTASDPFGLYVPETTDETRHRLVVYPHLVELPGWSLLPRQPIGDRRAPRQLLTDPARTVGVRDYHPSDPFKTIHWSATARRGTLQTRVFEPASTLELAIVLDLDTYENYWQGVRPDLVEYLISVAATVATAAERGQWSFGLYANAGVADSDELVRIHPDRNPAQLGLVLEALAKLIPFSVVGLPYLIRRSSSHLSAGATIVVISAVASTEMRSALLRLAQHGRQVRWLFAGDGQLPQVAGVRIERLRVTPPIDAGAPISQLEAASEGGATAGMVE